VEEIRLGTRGSQLALWQANAVASRVAAADGTRCRIVVIKTTGDHLQEAPISEVGGKRLFVKEIEDALLRRDIDVAVHSSKDMTAVLPAGLTIAAALPREDPFDAVVLPPGVSAKSDATALASEPLDRLIALLGSSPTIGTGSVRRIAQLTRVFRGARFVSIRGNLDTRLRKLDDGEYDALILAAAGLRRLGFASRISLVLPPSACLPAPGQGIVAIETREDDHRIRSVMTAIDDIPASAALRAERALIAGLGGGCQTPIGALASSADGIHMELVASVMTLDGSLELRRHATGKRDDAAKIGARVAAELLADGAGEILAQAAIRQPTAASRQSAAMTDE
jgi:hydroxymethylbilane synthase